MKREFGVVWAGGPVTIRDAGLDSFFFRRTPKAYPKTAKKTGKTVNPKPPQPNDPVNYSTPIDVDSNSSAGKKYSRYLAT